jgi:hypothetical protein
MAGARLSALKVRSLTKPGRYADGNGLYLQVSKAGMKAWLFRFIRDGDEPRRVCRRLFGLDERFDPSFRRALAVAHRDVLHATVAVVHEAALADRATRARGRGRSRSACSSASAAQRLRCAADLRRNRADRSPL